MVYLVRATCRNIYGLPNRLIYNERNYTILGLELLKVRWAKIVLLAVNWVISSMVEYFPDELANNRSIFSFENVPQCFSFCGGAEDKNIDGVTKVTM